MQPKSIAASAFDTSAVLDTSVNPLFLEKG
jgi:hypothetical protein